MVTITPTGDAAQNTTLISEAIALVGPNGSIHFPKSIIPHNGIVIPYPVSFRGEGRTERFKGAGTVLNCVDMTKTGIAFDPNTADATNGAVFSDLTVFGGKLALDLGGGGLSSGFTMERVNVTTVGATGGIHCGRPMERLFWKDVVVEAQGGQYGVLFDESTVADFSDHNGAYLGDSHFDRLWILGSVYGFVITAPRSRPWDGVKWTELRIESVGNQPFYFHGSATRLTFDGIGSESPFMQGVPVGMVKAGMIFKTSAPQAMSQIVVNLPAMSGVDLQAVNVQEGAGAELVVWNGTAYNPSTNYPAPSNLYVPPLS